jgi:hypothetical protein
MHVWLVGGIFNIHVGELMNALKPYGYSYATLHDYIGLWEWPKHVGTNTGKDACCKKRAKSSWADGTFKCQASEGLSLMPILANFAQQVLMTSATAAVVEHAQCFLYLADVMTLLVRSAVPGSVTPLELKNAIARHMLTYARLYGESSMVIKFHMACHFPMFLARWGFLPNCWPLERKHRGPKRFASELRNTRHGWEASVLRECTNQHIADLHEAKHFETQPGLINPSVPNNTSLLVRLRAAFGAPDDMAITVASRARINEYETCWKNDVVQFSVNGAHEINVGQVSFLCSIEIDAEEHCFACVRKWQFVSRGPRFSKWRISDTPLLVALADIKCTLIWSSSEGLALALDP